MEYHFETLGDGIEVAVSESHRFGTDAFLLADFARPGKRDRMVDFGTGCGIIPLLCRYRFGTGEIHGIEIQKEGADLFAAGIEKSGAEGIYAHHADLKNVRELFSNPAFDVVTCNPPYKKAGAGILSENTPEAIARHELSCTLDDVCQAAAWLLKFGGRLCICQRPERLADAMESMRRAGIEPKRLRLVSRRPETAPWLFLLEGRKGGGRFLTVEPQFYVQNEAGEFSDGLLEIYQKRERKQSK